MANIDGPDALRAVLAERQVKRWWNNDTQHEGLLLIAYITCLTEGKISPASAVSNRPAVVFQ
jgi:hypothetical protein